MLEIYAGTTKGLFASVDNGVKGNNIVENEVTGLVIDPAIQTTLYVALGNAGCVIPNL